MAFWGQRYTILTPPSHGKPSLHSQPILSTGIVYCYVLLYTGVNNNSEI